MNGVDTAILVITTLSFLFGLWRGLIKEVLSLLTWVAALIVARLYSEALSELLVNIIASSSIRYVSAFAMIFIVVMMLGTFLNYLMSKLLTITGLKYADRLLGGVFGVARGVIIVLVILFISGLFLSETEQWQQSTLIPYGLWMTEWLRMFVGDTNSVYLTQ